MKEMQESTKKINKNNKSFLDKISKSKKKEEKLYRKILFEKLKEYSLDNSLEENL